MCVAHEHANSVFSSSHADKEWIEVFHSRPSWRVCQISFKKHGGEWIPFGLYKLIDASDVRSGFRVFRARARAMELRLANGRGTVIDSNNGKDYHIDAPGRYVVESGSGCRRISDAVIADCLRALRPTDRYVELIFKPSTSWRNCSVTYAKTHLDQDSWHKVPMLPDWESGTWHQRLESPRGITCAFYDGGGGWDSNINRNYHIPLPGKYIVANGVVQYLGVSEADSSYDLKRICHGHI